MKRSQAFPGNYLGKDDVPNLVTAIIADVTSEPVKCEHGTEHKPVMVFARDQFKPLILNTVNWLALEDAYGEDSDGWRGKPVEIYVDPDVMFGGRRVGGIRLRVPTGPRPLPTPPPGGNGRRQVAATAQPASAPAPAEPPSLDALLDKALEAFSKVTTTGNLARWKEWADKWQWDDVHLLQLEPAYRAAVARLTPPPAHQPQPNRRPSRAIA